MWRTTAASHSSAQTDCAGLGGSLATYATYEEQLAVETYFVGQGQWAYLENMW